jgi:hypothetical protein
LFEITPLKDEIKDPEGRQLKAILWRKYQKLKPNLFAYVLDMLVTILKRRQQYSLEEHYGVENIEKLPRMADWALFCAVVSEEMAPTPEERKIAALTFIDNYYENINAQAKEAVEASPIAQCIIIMMANREYNVKTVTKDEKTGLEVTGGGDVDPDPKKLDPATKEEDLPWWQGISSHLLVELKETAKGNEIETKGKGSGFPANPSSLGKKLRAIQASLASNNGIYIFFIDSPHHSSRVIRIVNKNILQILSQYLLSTRHPTIVEQNQAQKQQNGGDRRGDGRNDDVPPVTPKQSSEPSSGDNEGNESGDRRQDDDSPVHSPVTQNHAQNEGGDRKTGEIAKVISKKLGVGWSNGGVRAADLIREPRLPELLASCMKDDQGNSRDYFTARDFVIGVQMLANSQYTEDQAVGMLSKLRTHGFVIETEPGRFQPIQKPGGTEEKK